MNSSSQNIREGSQPWVISRWTLRAEVRRKPVAQRLLAGLDNFVGFERTFGFKNVFLAGHEIAARAARREWTVIRFENEELVLGDDPVPWLPLGGVVVRSGGADLVWDSLVPLAPDTLLTIANRPGAVNFVTASEGDANVLVALSNEVQMSRSIRHVFFPPNATKLTII